RRRAQLTGHVRIRRYELAGVKGIGIPHRPKPGGLRVRGPPPVLDAGSSNGRMRGSGPRPVDDPSALPFPGGLVGKTRGSGSRRLRFESLPGSYVMPGKRRKWTDEDLVAAAGRAPVS